MLLMIRINLLGRQKGPKGSKTSFSLPRIPNVGLLLALLVLVIEGAVAFQWSQQAADDANRLEAKARQAREEVDEYAKIKSEVDEIKKKLEDNGKEKVIFDQLLAEKIGPVNAMTYLAFILAPRREAEVPGDELRQMELAGWRVAWPGERSRAWLTSIRERGGEVTLMGAALDHADVAEVQRRLESSAYFRDMRLVSQERKVEGSLGVPFVEFTIRGSLIYLIEPLRTGDEPPPEAAAAAGATDDPDATAGDGSADGEGEETSTVLKSAHVGDRDGQGDRDAAAGEVRAKDVDAEEPDVGPQPIVPRPVEAPARAAEPARPSAPPLIEHAADPPPAEGGADPGDPGASPAPTAPAAPAGGEQP